jgi:hypothetical protein
MPNFNIEPTRPSVARLDYATVKRDIAARLRNACADWSSDNSDAIVEKVTLTTLRFPRPGCSWLIDCPDTLAKEGVTRLMRQPKSNSIISAQFSCGWPSN